MTFQGDPYRTLGIVPGASLNEIRSAYRRLVKQYHPDAAGERALPRFLAIQAAYERLVDGDGRLRPVGPGGGRRGSGSTGATRGPGEPWRAEPARARASRDAWRARWGTGPGPGPGAGADAAKSAGPTAAGAGPAGTRTDGDAEGRNASTGAPPGPRPGQRSGRRGPRKATPGSTTYDEAAESPRDPRWEGGAWYGPSSGTYWTLNPREYADPRKHGPEYLARARRAAQAEADTAGLGTEDSTDERREPATETSRDGSTLDGATPEPTPETDVEGEGGRWRWSGAGRTTTDGGAAEWGTRAWTYRAAGPVGTAWTEGPGDRRRGGSQGARPDPRARIPFDAQDPGPLPDLESLARRASPRSLLALARRPDPRWRLLLALLGWPPIGFAAGSLLSTMAGCATFSAACAEPVNLLPVAIQPLVIATLFLIPPAAAAAAFASVGALAVALPVAAVLSVGTVPESRVGAPVLGVLTAVGYLVALAGGTIDVWRARPGDAGSAP